MDRTVPQHGRAHCENGTVPQEYYSMLSFQSFLAFSQYVDEFKLIIIQGSHDLIHFCFKCKNTVWKCMGTKYYTAFTRSQYNDYWLTHSADTYFQ